MTSKERMARAMDLEVPDRVPVMCQMSIGHMLLQTGLQPSEFWHSAEAFADGLLSMRALYGFDGVLISLHGHSPDWEKDVVHLERAADGERIHWANGDTTYFPIDDLPVHRPVRQPVKPCFAGFETGSIPNQISYIPVSQGLRFPLDPGHLFDVFTVVRKSVGKSYSLHGEVTSPLDYFLDLFGFEQALLSFVEDPDRSRAILQKLTDGILLLAAGIVAHGADAVKVSSPYAGAGFLSPGFYQRFVLPFEGQIVRAVRAAGAHAYLHTCGDVHDRLELMAGSGASGIECLDPPPLGRTDLEDAKRRIGRKIFIKGNIDPVHTLLWGDPASIGRDALRRIAIGSPGGGYILSTACSIAPRTPRENVMVLREVAEESEASPAD
jgi:uroporphyrinogen-III decarboxylase